MSKHAADINTLSIVVFDGYCNFCSDGIWFLLRQDRRKKFLFAASQTEEGKELLSHFNMQDTDRIYYFRKGVVLQASAALLYMVKDLGYPWKILFAFILVPKFIRDGVYNVVSKNRYRFQGKRKECRVPTESEKDHFY